MSQGSQFIPFQGGLDQVTQAKLVPRGRCIGCNNYQSGLQGYRRVDGYERFDGRLSPTAAGQPFIDEEDAEGARAARDAQRALIGPVPGVGPVRGVMRLRGLVYAVRDNNEGGATLYVATAGGWQVVGLCFSLDFTSGGTYQIAVGDVIVGATSAATATVRKVITVSGSYSDGTAAGYLVLDAITGTFVAENLKVGANANVASITVAPSAQTLPAGGRYTYRVKNFYGQPSSLAIYATNGVGRAFEFDGSSLTFIRTGLSDALDKPIRVAEHKNRLILGFLGGSVQGSQAGVPTSFAGTAGAFEITLGDELVDFLDNNVDSLAFICERSVQVLTGSTVLGSNPDLQTAKLTDEAGGVAFTAQKAGKAIYLDQSGVRSLDATSAYGDFKIGALTLGAQAYLDDKRRRGIAPVASLVTRTDDLYRLFFADGTGLSLYFGRKNPEPMLFEIGKTISCMGAGQDPDGVERASFGATDGYVYQLDTGTSYDGALIEAYIRLPFDHCGSPRVVKKWDKALLSTSPSPETKIGITYEFDFGDAEQPGTVIQFLSIIGGGGDWNTVNWNDFLWSAPINSEVEFELEGIGSCLATTLICIADDQRSHVLEGITLLYRGWGAKT